MHISKVIAGEDHNTLCLMSKYEALDLTVAFAPIYTIEAHSLVSTHIFV